MLPEQYTKRARSSQPPEPRQSRRSTRDPERVPSPSLPTLPPITIEQANKLIVLARKFISNSYEGHHKLKQRPTLAANLHESLAVFHDALNEDRAEETPRFLLNHYLKEEVNLMENYNLTKFGTRDRNRQDEKRDVLYSEFNFPLRTAAVKEEISIHPRRSLKYSSVGSLPKESERIRLQYGYGMFNRGPVPLMVTEILDAMNLAIPAVSLERDDLDADINWNGLIPDQGVRQYHTGFESDSNDPFFSQPPMGQPRKKADVQATAAQATAAQATAMQATSIQANTGPPVPSAPPAAGSVPGAPAVRERMTGYKHEGISHSPSANLPMPVETDNIKVNFTIVELMAFFPQILRSADVVSRICWNGGTQHILATMISAHRINNVANLPNSLLKIMNTSAKAYKSLEQWTPTKWKGQKPDNHDETSISMTGVRTFAEIDFIRGNRARHTKAPILFSSLVDNMQHLPTGYDAHDLTRCVQYVMDNRDQCRNYMFPDDYGQLINAVGGNRQVTVHQQDAAAFQRWRDWQQPPNWQQECQNFIALYGTQAPAPDPNHMIINPTFEFPTSLPDNVLHPGYAPPPNDYNLVPGRYATPNPHVDRPTVPGYRKTRLPVADMLVPGQGPPFPAPHIGINYQTIPANVPNVLTTSDEESPPAPNVLRPPRAPAAPRNTRSGYVHAVPHDIPMGYAPAVPYDITMGYAPAVPHMPAVPYNIPQGYAAPAPQTFQQPPQQGSQWPEPGHHEQDENEDERINSIFGE